MATMINEEKRRLCDFDGGDHRMAETVREEELDVNRFDNEGPAMAIE